MCLPETELPVFGTKAGKIMHNNRIFKNFYNIFLFLNISSITEKDTSMRSPRTIFFIID